MLYEYHKQRKSTKPTFHATYLVYGTKHEDQSSGHRHANGDGDVDMVGSGLDDDQEPLSDAVHTSTLTLVAEDELRGRPHMGVALLIGRVRLTFIDVLSQYDQVLSIHVYSLGPHPARVRGRCSERSNDNPLC
jgi:DNA polymerase delta subunit 3